MPNRTEAEIARFRSEVANADVSLEYIDRTLVPSFTGGDLSVYPIDDAIIFAGKNVPAEHLTGRTKWDVKRRKIVADREAARPRSEGPPVLDRLAAHQGNGDEMLRRLEGQGR